MSPKPARRAGRKSKAAPVTLPSLESLSPAERPRIVRTRLHAVARPLAFDVTGEHGEVTITQRLAPKVRPDDRLTPERRRHAVEAELLVVVDTFTTEAGEKTQLKRQRLVSPLERLWKAGTIDADQYGAARRYQRDVDMAAMAGPSLTVHYERRMIDGSNTRFLSPIEAALQYQRQLFAAQQACGPKLQRMLEWIATEPLGWRAQAKLWFSGASERSAREMFKRELRLTCEALEGHYRRRSVRP